VIDAIQSGATSLPAAQEAPPRTADISWTKRPMLTQYAIALAVIALVTLAAFLFAPIIGANATALVFLLTIVLLALFVDRGPTLAAAAMSAVLWEFFFLPPVFAFRINNFEDVMLFGMYFVVALVLGHLTTRIRAQEEAERERERRATALYLLTRALNESVDLNQMAQRSMQQLQSCFNAQVALLLPNQVGELRLQTGSTLEIQKCEQDIPRWVMEHRCRAGKFTQNLPSATCLYIPLTSSSGPVGVIALRPSQSLGLTIQQDNLLEAFSQQIAMALDRHCLNALTEKAKLLAESERLSKTLLDSMSHEIRTPIAAIKSATGNLAELQDNDTQIRREMISEIQEATERLNRLVGNVLEASRLESGAVKPRLNECDVGELIHVVLADLEKELSRHKVKVDIQPGLPVVRMDFVLMQHALTNLLSNAVFHTPSRTLIEIEARLEPENIALSVLDRGPGIPPDSLPRIFDKFYRVPNSRTGGTGLGLSLVKGFVEAQSGRVSVENRPDGGAAFTIRLPKALSSPTVVETNL
jgi:two-component system sensor histidine kinase KdpD